MADINKEYPKVKVEQYRPGYPRLAAFLNVDGDFTVLKRFDNLHMRSLLEQQDGLQELEAKLDHCDDTESIQLHLSSHRQDSNQVRRDLMRDIAAKLKAYGMEPNGPSSNPSRTTI
ncbi:MAG: hypothetical protein M1821_007048 [Bathelium mastoideum]|nr:MAG: hypothetical protein M1821_007048 [Bathelium mastoideum]